MTERRSPSSSSAGSRPGGSPSHAGLTRFAPSDIALLPECCNRGIGTTARAARGTALTHQSDLRTVASLLPERLEFSDRLEVFRPSRGTLHANQRVESEAPAGQAKEIERLRVRKQIVVPAAARDLPQEIQVSKIGGQREVRPDARVARSNRNGNPGGAPRRYGRKGATVFSSRSKLVRDRA